MKKGADNIRAFLLMLIILMVGTYGFLHSIWLKKKVISFVESTVNEQIDGELSIGKMKGNILNHLLIQDVVLTLNSDTLLFVDELEMNYRLMKLRHRVVDVHKLILKGVEAKVTQLPDFSFDWMHLMSSRIDTIVSLKDTISSDFSFVFHHVAVDHLTFHSETREQISGLPESMQASIFFSCDYGKNQFDFILDSMKVKSQKPDLSIERFVGKLSYKNDAFELENMELKTARSLCTFSGQYAVDRVMQTRFQLQFNPLDLGEFSSFFGDQVLGGDPVVEVGVGGDDASLDWTTSIVQGDQRVLMKGKMMGFEPNDSVFISGRIENMNGETWLLDSNWHSSVSGHFEAAGHGLTLDDSRWKVSASFSDLNMGKWEVNHALFSFVKSDDSLFSSLDVKSRFGNVNSNIEMTDLSNRLPYCFNAKLQGVDLSKFTLNPEHVSKLNLTLAGKGQGFDLHTALLNFEMDMDELEWGAYHVKNIHLSSHKVDNRLKGAYSMTSIYGESKTQYSLDSIFTRPGGHLSGEIARLDLGSLLHNDTLKSNIHLFYEGDVRGNNLNDMELRLNLSSHQSTFMGGEIDDFYSTILYSKGKYLLTGFDIQSPYFKFMAKGDGDMNQHNDIRFRIAIKNIDPLFSYFADKYVHLKGEVEGHLTGYGNNLNVDLEASNLTAEYDSIKVDNLNWSSSLNLLGDRFSGTFNMNSAKTGFGNYTLNRFNAEGDISNDHYRFVLEGGVDFQNHGRLVLDVIPDSITHFDFSSMAFCVDDKTWYSLHDTSSLWLMEDAIRLSEFSLINELQRVSLSGLFSFNDSENVKLQIDNLDLKTLPFKTLIATPISGTLNSTFTLSGKADEPLLNGLVDIEQIQIDTVNIDRLTFFADYSDKKFRVSSELLYRGIPLFSTHLEIPLQLSFADSIVLPSQKDEINGWIQCKAFELSLLNPVLDPLGWVLDGTIDSKIEVSNTLDQLDLSGPFNLKDGRMMNKAYGINYNNVQLNALWDHRQLNIEELSAQAGKGSLMLDGLLGFKPGLDFLIDTLNTSFSGKNFKLMNSREMEATVDADLNVVGNDIISVFDGDLTLIRSRTNVDVFLERKGTVVEDMNPPLLVQAMADTIKLKMNPDGDYVDLQLLVKDTSSPLLKRMTGVCNITIPRNTWITGRDMNFELMGDLKVLKTGSDFELFGDLSVRRGYYKLYGKKFSFVKGDIAFSGGADWNPSIDFEVVYRFRTTDGELKALQLNAQGKINNPQLSFLLDDVVLEEKEAMSYLLLNRSLNELSSGQQSSIEKNVASIAKTLALGKLTSVLQSTIQTNIPIDVIEMSGDKQWGTGGVTIGKYLTNNLYLEYQRNFVFDKQSRIIDPEIFTLEYKLFHSWFIQATNQHSNSGFDLLLKRFWK